MGLADQLIAEHQLFRRILKLLGRVATLLDKQPQRGAPAVGELLQLISVFGDREHHAKEEHALFPALHAAGLPLRYGPLAVMMMEHERGRELLREMSRSAAKLDDAASKRAFSTAARDYVTLLEGHIEKEDTILFPMAEKMIPPERLAAVQEAFSRLDANRESGGPEAVAAVLDRLQAELA